MCLILVAYKTNPDLPLVIAANRDEFHSRPTQKADWWADDPDMLGGRDLQAGGTWLAVHRRGRFAAVTNFRDADAPPRGKHSRGSLVTRFLQGVMTPGEYVDSLHGDSYAGFNLLVYDGDSLAYYSNRSSEHGLLAPGVYGLGNATLDTTWEKVERGKQGLQSLLASKSVNETTLLRLLAERKKGPVEDARSDRLPFTTAHAITAPFIVLPEYGTRCSSVVLADSADKWSMLERRFSANGEKSGESRFSFSTVDGQ